MTLGASDPDIGLCDWCGDTEGRRDRVVTVGVVDGVRQDVCAWLCRDCRITARNARTAQAVERLLRFHGAKP